MAKKSKELFPKSLKKGIIAYTVYGYHRSTDNVGNYIRATNCDEAKFEAKWNLDHGDEKSIIVNNVSKTKREMKKLMNGEVVYRVI
jgi:hypothetical protein